MGDSRGRNEQIQESEDREGTEEKKETPVFGLCAWACSHPVVLLPGMASGSMTTDKHLDLWTIGR